MSDAVERKREAQRRYQAKRRLDPEWQEKNREYMREYAKKNKDKLNAQASERYYRSRRYSYRLKRLGITPTPELIERIETHSGKCDICGAPGDGRWGELSIDHCHGSGMYRGMLCSSCNRALGLFKDDPNLLSAAIAYLDKHRKLIEASFN